MYFPTFNSKLTGKLKTEIDTINLMHHDCSVN